MSLAIEHESLRPARFNPKGVEQTGEGQVVVPFLIHGSQEEQATGASIQCSDRRLLDIITRLYRTAKPDAVVAFLFNRPHLPGLLLDGWMTLKDLFPESCPTIEVHIDEEGESRLIVEIPTPLSLNEAYSRLQVFDERWWLGSLAMARGALGFNLALQ